MTPFFPSQGGIYGNSHSGSSSSSGVVPPVTHTQITYNNYYNNGSEAAGAPNAAGAGPVPAQAPAAAAPAAAAPDAAPAAAVAPAAPAAANPEPNQQQNNQQQQQNSPSPLGSIISDAELQKLTEGLFSKDVNNAFKHITVKAQGQKTDDSTTDDAPEK